MPKIDNHQFYSSAIKKYGVCAKGVNWNSASTQNVRFKIICKLLPQNIEQYQLLDAGCGFGDLYHYLQKTDKLPSSYEGIDCHDDMVSIASNNTGCCIYNLDIIKDSLPLADYVICSGAMNTLSAYESFLFMKKCFEVSKKAFIFNILHGDKESQTYNYLSRKQIEEFANKLNVKKVTFVDGYLDADISVKFEK